MCVYVCIGVFLRSCTICWCDLSIKLQIDINKNFTDGSVITIEIVKFISLKAGTTLKQERVFVVILCSCNVMFKLQISRSLCIWILLILHFILSPLIRAWCCVSFVWKCFNFFFVFLYGLQHYFFSNDFFL